MSNDDNNLNRRSIVKGIGASTAAFSLGGIPAVSSAQASSTSGLSVVDASIDQNVSTAAAEMVSQNSVVDELASLMEDEAGLSRQSSSTTISLTTNDDELNALAPRIEAIPFTKAAKTSKNAAKNAASQVRTGVLFITTALQDGTRVPASAFGLSTEALSLPSNANGNPKAEITTYGAVDGTPSVLDTQKVQTRDPVSSSGDVQTQDDLIDCFTCTTLVTALCELGAGRLGQSTCVSRCLPLISTLAGYTICAGSCLLLVEAIERLGCGVTAATLCAAATICP